MQHHEKGVLDFKDIAQAQALRFQVVNHPEEEFHESGENITLLILRHTLHVYNIIVIFYNKSI
ncbi:hypothetical protein LguiA_030058 [Lonicera macranthoides]